MSTEEIDFGKLFELHGRVLRRTLRRYGGPLMPVEDGLQDVFRIALEKYTPGRPADVWLVWLIKTAFHVARNWRREARHDREVPGVEADAADDHSPDYWFTAYEEWRGIHKVIDTLDEHLREVFVLAEIENMPLAKIAAALDLPLWTVNYRLHCARHAFVEEGRRRRAAGLLGVLALLHRAESGSKAAANRALQNAGWALFGGAAVAAWFLSRPSPPTPIHAEPPVIAEAPWIPAPAPPAPPMLDLPQTAPQDVPASSLRQPPPVDPDESARDEYTLIDTATLAFDQHRYREALQLLARHKRMYPHGMMATERDNLIRQVNRLIETKKKSLG